MFALERFDRYERKLALRAESTRRNYRSALNTFISITGLTKEKIVELAEKDLGELELKVQEAMNARIEAGRASSTAYMIYKAVRFFLKACGLKGFQLDREDKPRLVYKGSRRVTKKHIVELWDSFSAGFKTRNRAILMFLKDSGLRISDACSRDVEHYLAARTSMYKEEPFKVFAPFATQKVGVYANTHIGPEAVEALERYIGDRRTGPLFLSRKGGRLRRKAMSEVIVKVIRRRELRENYDGISTHSLRKFHFTMLPFRDEWIYWLEGKATSVYVDAPLVTQAYMESYDTIRVHVAATIQDAAQDSRIEELERRVKMLGEHNERMIEQVEILHLRQLGEIRAAPEILEAFPQGLRLRRQWNDGIANSVTILEPIEESLVTMLPNEGEEGSREEEEDP